MTVRTPSYLKNILFATAQSSGAITALRFQDISDSLAARTLVSVTEYGADPSGVADSTTAFQSALAAGPTIVPAFQSNGSIATYLVSNCIVPPNGSLYGFNNGGFVGGGAGIDGAGSTARPQILPVNSGTVRLFNVDNVGGARFSGLVLSGAGTSLGCDGISGGSLNMQIDNCLITQCNHAVGGAVAGSTANWPNAHWEMKMWNTNIQYCHTGITDMVDSFIAFVTTNGCDNGILTANTFISQANHVIGCRFEWCGRSSHPNNPYTTAAGWGTVLYGNLWTFDGCEWDANGQGGAQISGGHMTFNGCMFTRNGCNVTSGTTLISTSSHLYFDGARNITVSGSSSYIYNGGTDGFVYSPAFFAYFNGGGGNNDGVSFIGNDLSGCQGATAGATLSGPVNSSTAWRGGTVPTGTVTGGSLGYIISKNFGTGLASADVDTRT